MNLFYLHYKEGNSWEQVNAIFPFTVGDLLDERLDESTVVFYDQVKSYKPLTEFRFTAFGTENPVYMYFILANDNSAEYPAGSGRYRHEVYLIERMKLTEGILCQSLTFSNVLPKGVSKITGGLSTQNIIDVIAGPGQGEDDYGKFETGLLAPEWAKDQTFHVPTAKEMSQHLGLYMQSEKPGNEFDVVESLIYAQNQVEYFTSVEVYCDNTKIGDFRYESQCLITPSNLANAQYITLNYTSCFDVDLYTGSSGQNVVEYSFKIEVVNGYAPLKPYSITDCVIRVLELAEPLLGTRAPRFTFDGVRYDANGSVIKPYTQGSQAEVYDKIFAPEFSMTQSTLREQLKVIGSYIHAEPWLDENNVVHYLDLGDQEKITMGDYISHTLKTDINSFCTEIRSNVQNLVSSLGYAKGAIIDPGVGLYRSLRCETMYARINEENGIADTDYPVHNIVHVECGFKALDGNWVYDPKDITQFVFESVEYNANLSSFTTGYPYSKAYGIYYTHGSRGLHGLFHQVPRRDTGSKSPYAIANILGFVNEVDEDIVFNAIVSGAARLVFRITYTPIAPGFISHGKQYYISEETPYTQIYNQSENTIETQYFGENMKGVAARLGNIEQTRTYMLSSLSQVPKVGMMLDDYSISAVHYEYMPNFIKVTLGLSKDYNRISEYVGINSVKRMYEISERQTQKRDILIKENIVITSDPTMEEDTEVFFKTKTAILGAFNNDVINKPLYNFMGVKFAIFAGYTKNDTSLNKDVILPVITRAFGNTIHFFVQFKDNYSAGSSSEWIEGGENVTGYWLNDVPYTDFYGRIYWGKIVFPFLYNLGDNAEEKISNASFSLPSAVDIDTAGTTVMVTSGGDFEAISDALSNAPKIRIRKDNREILGFNIEAEFKTTEEDVVIGSELAAMCKYVNNRGATKLYVSKVPLNKLKKHIPINSVEATDEMGSFGIHVAGFDTEDLSEGSTNYDVLNNKNYLRVSLKIEELHKNSYVSWFIATPLEPKTEYYTNDDGEVEGVRTYTGGDILIGGNIRATYRTPNGDIFDPSMLSPEDQTTYDRYYYFISKRR